MKLFRARSAGGRGARSSTGLAEMAYKTGVFEALYDVWWKRGDQLLVRIAGRSLVVERDLIHGV